MTETDKLRAKGYTIHDGSPCPFNESTQPGVVMDDGTVILPGTVTANRIDWSQVRAFKVLPGNSSTGMAFGGGSKAKFYAERIAARGK